MVVLVAGSKKVKDLEVISLAISESGFTPSKIVVCSGTGTGSSAVKWAEKNTIPVVEVLPDWYNLESEGAVIKVGRGGKKYNAAAGKEASNKAVSLAEKVLMVCESPEDGEDVWKHADELGIECHIYRYDQQTHYKKQAETQSTSSVEWAKEITLNKKAVVLDTESSGGSADDEVISIGIVRLYDGKVLLNTLIKPSEGVKFNYYAAQVHGITKEMLSDAPTFREVWSKLRAIIRNNDVLAYNYSSDRRMLMQTAEKNGLKLPEIRWHCVMKEYKKYTGRGSNTNLTTACNEMNVPPGTHDALDDSLATARLVFRIAKEYRK